MCLAIYKPKDVIIPEEYLANGFMQNSDGAGFAYYSDEKVTIKKGFFSFNEFMVAYKEFEQHPMLIHFRWATHGEPNRFNCHPWGFASDTGAVVHNGIINIESTKEMSDTGHFVYGVIEPLFKSGIAMDSPHVRYLIETSITNSNKLLLMQPDGKVIIYNEDEGEWDKCGAWFSNDGYKELWKRWGGKSSFYSRYYEDEAWERGVRGGLATTTPTPMSAEEAAKQKAAAKDAGSGCSVGGGCEYRGADASNDGQQTVTDDELDKIQAELDGAQAVGDDDDNDCDPSDFVSDEQREQWARMVEAEYDRLVQEYMWDGFSLDEASEMAQLDLKGCHLTVSRGFGRDYSRKGGSHVR